MTTWQEHAYKMGKLLEDPARRCTGEAARDKDGLPVPPESDAACSWCLIGALYACDTHYLNGEICYYIRKYLGIINLPGYWVHAWEGPGADQDAIVAKLLAAKDVP